MAEYKKQVLTFPDLPTAIQGDGRQLISLLRKYLKSVNEQVNVANGFTADDVDASNKGDFPMPRNFTLTFDRLGGYSTGMLSTTPTWLTTKSAPMPTSATAMACWKRP